MSEGTSQPSDTGKSGIQIPKERFDEVSAQAKEAKERAAEAERKFQASETARLADAKRIEALERRFAPEPEESVYMDPGEKALAELEALKTRFAAREAAEEMQARYRADGNAITSAIDAAGIEDKKKASEALATQYGASKHFGSAWDPVASAKAYREEEKAVAELRARAAKDNADATRSVITGSASAPAVSTAPLPKRPSPAEENYSTKVREWEAAMEKRLVEEARAAG